MILRQIFVALGLNVNQASFAKGQIAATLVTAAVSKMAEVAHEAVSHFMEMIQRTAESGKTLSETAQSTGLSTKALQEFQDVAGGLGIETGTLNMSFFRLSRAMLQAKQGTGSAADTFHKLGAKVTDAHGKLRSTEDVMMDMADGFAKMPDGAEKTALAMNLFGRSGARLIPVLNKGKQGLAAMRAETTVMTDEQITAGKEVIETQYALGLVTRNLWRAAIAPLLPAINALLKRYLEWKKANAAIMAQRISAVIGVMIKAVTVLTDVFGFLIRNIVAIELLLGGLAIYFAITKASAIGAAIATAAAWLVAAAPFIAIGALIAGFLLVFDDLRMYMKYGDKAKTVFGDFKHGLDEWMKPRTDEPWFVTAVRKLVEWLQKALDIAKALDLIDSDKKGEKKVGGTEVKPNKQGEATKGGTATAGTETTPGKQGFMARYFGPRFADKDTKERIRRGEVAVGYNAPWESGAGYNYNPTMSEAVPDVMSRPPEMPEYRPGPQSGMSYSPTVSVAVTVNPAPNMSEEAVGKAVATYVPDVIESYMSSVHEDAAAASGH